MNTLIRGYILSRGGRVAAVVLLGVAVLGGLGCLPQTPLWVGIRLLLLLAGLLWAFRAFQTPALAFCLSTLLVLLLFQQPLGSYVIALYQQAQSPAVFMIVLFGGALLVVSRQDLLEALAQATEPMRRSPEYPRLEQEAAVVCLLRRFDAWIQHKGTIPILREALLFVLVLINFVSSSMTVLFFKSLWASPQADFRTQAADQALAAGILCFCICGGLLVYVPGVIASPSWLFFATAMGPNNTAFPQYPIAVYLYGIFSFVHGLCLIFGRPCPSGATDQMPTRDLTVQRLQGLYLVLVLVCSGAVCLAFLGFALPQPGPMEQPLLVSTVVLGVLLAVLLAQGLLYSLFMRPTEEGWHPSSFWHLMVHGMRGVFGTVVTLVVLVAFKNILTNQMAPLTTHPVLPLVLLASTAGQILVISGIFVLTFGIGRLIGTSWGTFTIGLLLVSMSGIKIPTILVEALILLATWVNQSSLAADNVQTMLGPTQVSRATLTAVWAVPTFPRYPALQAQYIQYGLLGVSLGLALVCQYVWPKVL
jgi:hypothetical protein